MNNKTDIIDTIHWTGLEKWHDYRRITIKIGSALLVNAKSGEINHNWLKALADDINALRANGKQVFIVSSGAVALGRKRLGLTTSAQKPFKLNLAQKQACAAAGQTVLTQAYETVLSPYGLVTAQALLTLNDTENRRQWLNASQTLRSLASLGAIPIINENDTVATDEIRYGDNDRLAARVSQMVGADLLILLSDIDGLYTADPLSTPDAKHIPVIDDLNPDIMAMGGGANQNKGMGTGGMATKLQAAKIAMNAGCTMVITKGETLNPLKALIQNSQKSSWFTAKENTQTARKQWIASSIRPKGIVTIDQGACRALHNGKSLLCAGVTAIQGQFEKGDSLQICNDQGEEIAIGLSAYSHVEAHQCQGLSSHEIDDVLGFAMGAPLIHRDNLVLSQ